MAGDQIEICRERCCCSLNRLLRNECGELNDCCDYEKPHDPS